MIYGSVCSGIEAASAAWLQLGWEPAWFAEIDPFCCALLDHHYPGVRNLGDIRHVGVEQGTVNAVELLVGGTPCQDFSVNGLRTGLVGDRGSITSEYLRLVGSLRPRWIVWENVVGVLDADRGTAFGAFVWSLAQCGYSAAWRVLDLLSFGIPQQRRRLFLVGHLGAGSLDPATVLFDAGTGGKNAGSFRAVRWQGRGSSDGDAWPAGWTGDPTPKCCPGYSLTLRSQQGGEGAGIGWPGIARRLTPREWERLNGFKADYTLVPFKGKPASDSQRKHALGNTFPVPILRWLGERIDHLEKTNAYRQPEDTNEDPAAARS